jgi:hypothetical protein
MKILNLLSGIYGELRRLNENLERYPSLGENAAVVAEFNAKAARLRNNPLIGMTNMERERFKGWIAGQSKTWGLTPEDLTSNRLRREGIKAFLQDYTRCASIVEVRDALANILGYQDFISLYEDYKTQAGGAA